MEEQLGKSIKKLRKKLKMSQREFGIKLGEVMNSKPIIHTTIYRWESDSCKPRKIFLEAIEKIRSEMINDVKCK
jgi:transcriptional regulator with XRE-family HTH domain